MLKLYKFAIRGVGLGEEMNIMFNNNPVGAVYNVNKVL